MKIGMIQTRGIGDIVIAAPIAQYYIDQGHEVLWPVDARFAPFVQSAFPDIRFIPVDRQETGGETLLYFFAKPLVELKRAGCDPIFCLYSYLDKSETISDILGFEFINKHFAHSLKFDEYKYAIAEVPFEHKWKLRIVRDAAREQALMDRLEIRGRFVLVHELGSHEYHQPVNLTQDFVKDAQVVRISEVTDNPFDWLGLIERADVFICIDSCFANLAEQLNLCPRKFLLLRSSVQATPVFKNGWRFR